MLFRSQILEEHRVDGAGRQSGAVTKDELGNHAATVTFGAVRVAVIGVGGENADRFVVNEDNAAIQGNRFNTHLLVNRAVAAAGLQALLVEWMIAAVHHQRVAPLGSRAKEVAFGLVQDHPGHPLITGDPDRRGGVQLSEKSQKKRLPLKDDL